MPQPSGGKKSKSEKNNSEASEVRTVGAETLGSALLLSKIPLFSFSWAPVHEILGEIQEGKIGKISRVFEPLVFLS